MALGGAVVGTALIRVQPSLAGFGTSVAAGIGSGATASALMRGGAAASMLITAPIVAGLGKAIGEAVSQESAFAGVKKTVNATDAEYRKLEDTVTRLSNSMPFAFEQVAGVMEQAGRFGIDTDNLGKATELFLKLGTAIPDMDPANAAEQLTRLSNILGTGTENMDRLASSIVALGNDFPTTEQAILMMSMRIAGAAEVVGMADSATLGWAAGLSALGVRAEMGGSAISRVFLTINDAVASGGDAMKSFADIAGVSMSEFKKLWEESPDQAVLKFIEGLKRLNDEGKNLNPILKELGLGEIRVRDVLLRASSNPALIAEALKTAKTGFEENIALNREYEKRLDTTAAKWQIVKNNFNNAFAELGKSLLPILVQLMEALTPVIEFVSLLAQGFAKLPEPIQKVALVMLLVVAAAGPLAVILPRLAGSIKSVNDALKATQAFSTKHPWLVLAMAIALVAILVIQNWDKIKEKVGEILTAIDAKLYEWGQKFRQWWIDNIMPIVDWLQEWWERIKGGAAEAWNFIVGIFNIATALIGGWIQTHLIGPIQTLVGWWETAKTKAGEAWNWIVEKFNWAKDNIVKAANEIAKAIDKALGPMDEIFGGAISFGKKVLGFDEGGVVPGPKGSAQLILAHGGETILPTHKKKMGTPLVPTSGGGDMYVQGPLVSLENAVIRDERDIVTLAREIERERQRAMKARG